MARTWRQTLIHGCTVIARTVLGAMVIGLAVIALLLYTMDFPHSHNAQCYSNLRQIGLALLNYEAAQGALPPAYIADKSGVPMHSWRVLLLPYLEQPELFARYDFSQPWNSPKNSQLEKLMPPIFHCPNLTTAKPGYTSYCAAIGPGHVFDGTKSTRLHEIADGASTTIMVMEVPDSRQISWLSPFDAPIATARSNHPRMGSHALFADGSVQFLGSETTPELIAAMQSIAGGESTRPDKPPEVTAPPPNLPITESLQMVPQPVEPNNAKE